MAQKPSIPKGTRDFLPKEVARRTYIFDTIKTAFKKYGFSPIETPSFELSQTLMGKYGDEGDRLIFKILNSGDYIGKYTHIINLHIQSLLVSTIKAISLEIKKTDSKEADYLETRIDYLLTADFVENIIIEFKKNKTPNVVNYYAEELFDILRNEVKKLKASDLMKTDVLAKMISDSHSVDPMMDRKIMRFIQNVADRIIGEWFRNIPVKYLTPQISEKALRYDLTVPFARFVVQHQSKLSFPFKRYQIQPVWRADRPQHGRYQEFFQCDADVVGSNSLMYEVDFVQLFDEILTNLQIPSFTILINNRKILSGIAEVSGEQDKLIDITVAIDKLDKIGQEGVEKELRENGISEEAIEKIRPLFDLTGSNKENLSHMASFLEHSEIGMKGIEELNYVLDQVEILGLERAELKFDVTLARGLNYYTGAIFEVKVNNIKMGSICGGGRYDDLTGLFGMPDMSGVGISFGADRIYDVLTELDLFPSDTDKGLTLLFVNFGEKEQAYCMKLAKEIRLNGIDCELYPTAAKMQKQMKYANDIRVQHVALVGETEMSEGLIQLKNMETGDQEEMSLEELIYHLTKK